MSKLFLIHVRATTLLQITTHVGSQKGGVVQNIITTKAAAGTMPCCPVNQKSENAKQTNKFSESVSAH